MVFDGSKMKWVNLKTLPLKAYGKLAAALFTTILIVWSFDAATLWDSWKTHKGLEFDAPARALFTIASHSNRVPNQLNASLSSNSHWIQFPQQHNETETLLQRLAQNGTHPCHGLETVQIKFLGFPGGNPAILQAGIVHSFTFTAYDQNAQPRCSGGDYYESDLSSPSWKSRPPVVDMGNGSYIISFQIDPRLAGLYRLTVILLFGNYNGLHRRPEWWARRREMLSFTIHFTWDSNPAPPLRRCTASDFALNAWSGRWTRGPHNESCEINHEGRFLCLPPQEPCPEPWCTGFLSDLESNGWVYSAHCSFHIFDTREAWRCLDKKWLFFWGDSNHGDTIRNLLNFVLGLWHIKALPRRFDKTFVGPGSRRVRITNVFNGHWNETLNYQGLFSLSNDGFRELLRSFFTGTTLPDVMIMNSGLHDGLYCKDTHLFVNGAEMTAKFWGSVMDSVDRRGLKRPVFLYRSTIAPGGYARGFSDNPHKMETYNRILLEKLQERNLISMVVDNFDLTFPWHFDNNCSDGVHYGRPPAKAVWRDGQIGHQYFVDLMLIHILLNAICMP
ncbi:hypothetical protein SUGI_0143450 [Cryptomeria japonica]|uniref:uncharacterized protein LOC131075402 n=1 Tax=Cryptomeria japonica TaxID=3369 RepID=UPI002408ACA3|nr:uncharacterized protein LOC131075402 [Cryptomeria japonica]GLJ11114.1 hypothetical protein SUGI_0143450 [Cryptomeria japonica]